MEIETMKMFILLLLFTASCVSENDDLYNTKAATTDLHWTRHPSQNGWEELSNPDQDGSIIRSYQVCTIGKQLPSNWIRTPYIASKTAKRAYIDVEFSMRKCDDLNSDCKETFDLYYFETDKDEASSTFPPWRETPYVKIDTIAAGERFGFSDVDSTEGFNHKTWTLGPLSKNGFYIAAHDQGACMSILSLRVYYFYCPEVEKGLATFPRTLAGNETTSLTEVRGICVSHASAMTTEGPRYYCNSNGGWKVRTGLCHCDPGFQIGANRTSCNVCSVGHYKNSHGNHECVQCPRNSVSSDDQPEEGSKLDSCVCSPGYRRSPEESVHAPCSKPPSAPTKVKCTTNVTSASLSWQPPEDDGGRSDVYYNVVCERCDRSRKNDTSGSAHCSSCSHDVIFQPANHNRLRSTSCTISNLNPYTTYKFQILSMNGVTSLSHLAPARHTVTTTTKEGVPSAVTQLLVPSGYYKNLSVTWSPPLSPNGQILKYEVSWTEKTALLEANSISQPKTSTALETNNTSARIPGLVPDHSYTIQVRAATSAGFGPYSVPVDVRATSSDLSTSNQDAASLSTIHIVVIISVLFIVVVLLGVIFLRYKKRKTWIAKRMRNHNDSEEKVALHSNGELTVHLPPQTNSSQRTYVEYSDPYVAVQQLSNEIEPGNLKIEDCIGQGEFGEVCRGKLLASSKVVDVAVKRMRKGSTDRFNFLREAFTMAQFSHPNVIHLEGVVTRKFPYMIITEYMENGALDSYLKTKNNQLALAQLMSILQGIASGMRYLSNMKYIHRDLAARNILVDNNLNCKVSDFGLSRTLENNPNATYTTQGGKIAIRWTAPECIRLREFTSASDVWSYGIVMWEVTSYGEKPYWDMSNKKVLESIDDGYRLPAPHGCPISLHRLMVECWAFEAKMRPTMDDVCRRLEELLRHPASLNKVAHKQLGAFTKPSVENLAVTNT